MAATAVEVNFADLGADGEGEVVDPVGELVAGAEVGEVRAEIQGDVFDEAALRLGEDAEEFSEQAR